MTEPAPKAVSRRLRPALVTVGFVAAAAALAVYAARGPIAAHVLTAWLKSKGLAASAKVDGLGMSGVTAALSLGDPRRPDFTAERVEVGYGLTAHGLEVRSVKLVRPVLRASLRGGRFSAGALDPLIEEFRNGPPRANAAQPQITIEGGRLLLATDYGPLQVDADAVVASGRLRQLSARTAPARLRGPGFDVSLGAAALSSQAAGPGLEVSVEAPVPSATAGAFGAANAHLRATAAGPYPDLSHGQAAGALAAHAELTGGRLVYGATSLQGALVSLGLTGRVHGGLRDLAFAGRGSADLRADGAAAAGGAAGPAHLAAAAEQLSWTRKGGDTLRAQLSAAASLERYARKDVQLAKLTAGAQGPVGFVGGKPEFDLVARAFGHGAWTGLGPPAAADSAEIAAAKRAARGFAFAAPAVAVRGPLAARLLQPARLTPDRGGAVVLAPQGRGWRLTAAGGGLPKLDAAIDRVERVPGGAAASGRIQAALSIGLVQGGVYDAAGTLRLANGTVSFAGSRCAQVVVARVDLGANDVRKLDGRLCPAGRPLISLGKGDFRIAGRAEGLSAEVPFLQARVSGGEGLADLASVRGAVQAQATIARAQVADAAPQTRFKPVGVTGEARLARGRWTAGLLVRDGGGRPLARVSLEHEELSGRGGLTVDTGTLRFAPGGMQPVELSPLAATIGSPAEGEAQFTGAFSWTKGATQSSGVLAVPRLDFVSPGGKVSGLSGRVVFSSLAPLVAPSGQVLQAAAIAAPAAPLEDARVSFGVTPAAIRVAVATAGVKGGTARIENLEVPLVKDRPIQGVLDLEGVQLHDLVEASPFGDRVDLYAKVSGRIPFTVEGDKVRVAGGGLRAVEPGRLSIQRAALTGVAASGAVSAPGAPGAAAPQPSTDTFSDFAYQAMENLAFTTLTASVESRPDGRLGVVFHIVGKHDPPQHQEIRLSWLDLIHKRFLGKQLPLPSGTGVDLTLDTTLNLDDLLSDYAEFRRLHGSAAVQP